MLIKSPLRYPGGKSRTVTLISSLIPDFTEFREPFVGGGSVFIYLRQKYPKKQFWINDLYFPLYTFWSICQKDLESLIKQIWIWKTQFNRGKDLYKFLNENIAGFNSIQIASAFFVYNRITFSGTTESGGFSEQAFQKRFTDSSIKRLENLSFILKDVRITNLDFEKVINENGKDVFLFLDPPYFSSANSALYGKNGNMHKNFDHQRLAKTLKNCKHKWLITYDDSEYIRELYKFAHIIPWNLTYGMRNVTSSSHQNGQELFISNYLEEFPSMEQLFLFPRDSIFQKSSAGNKIF